jgi:diguanylate cyclase (GGDEF)-like protein
VQTVISTLFEHHDLRLVALAAMVCGLSAFAGITLLTHARRTDGAMKFVWVGIAAVSVGFGIWATHFIAMLSFSAGMPTGYDVPLSILSLGIAITIVGGGLLYATVATRRSDAVLGGAIVGIGISAMHYVGMSALLVGGQIAWDPWLVSTSLLLGITLGGLSLFVGTYANDIGWRLRGALLLTLAICAMHFTAMGAAGLENCYPIVTAAEATPVWLSLVVAAGSILVLLFAFGGIALDQRDRRRSAAEADRMRGLADAAVEGLMVVKDGHIVTANASFMGLVEVPQAFIAGRHLADFFAPSVVTALSESLNTPIETEVSTASGNKLPVEVIMRQVDFGGTPHQAVAVRDLSGRRKAEQHIRFLAHHDALTGLPNRASFTRKLDDEIAHAKRHGQSFAVLGLDLDRFKEVNDLFGHPAGDALLQRVARALEGVIDGRGSAARLGGDEFAVLLKPIHDEQDALLIADKIIDSMHSPIELPEGGRITTSLSIGIALYPEHADSPEALVHEADVAMYHAKRSQGGRRLANQELSTH